MEKNMAKNIPDENRKSTPHIDIMGGSGKWMMEIKKQTEKFKKKKKPQRQEKVKLTTTV